MGASDRTPGNLRPAAVPGWEAPFEEMAPSGVALRCGDLAAQRRRHAGARAAGQPRGGAQPVRDRGSRMADGWGVRAPAAVAVVHARLGPEPGAALPAFRG